MQMASTLGRRWRTTGLGHSRISRVCDFISTNRVIPLDVNTAALNIRGYHSSTTPLHPCFLPQNDSRSVPAHLLHSHVRQYSSSTVTEKYAAIEHAQAYENAMKGRHGQQLALARLEGIGKDDPPFDPFSEDEQLLSQQLLAEEGDSLKDDDDDGYHGDVSEDDDEDFDDEDEGPLGSRYNPDGSLRRKKSVLATLRAGFPAGGLFAIIELAGAQHKVTTDDLLVVNRLQPVDIFKIGSIHTLQDVMLVGSSHLTLVGMPYVEGAQVDVMVEEITQDAKVIIFKKRRRKNSQRRNGFRRDLTLLRVVDIRLPEEYQNHDYVPRESVDELDLDRTVIESNPPQPEVAAAKAPPSPAPVVEEKELKHDSENKEQLKTA